MNIATIARAVKVAAVAMISGAVVLGLAGPAAATSGAMFGDPAVAAKYWRYQQYWDDCVLVSTADVVGEVTGVEPSEEAIIDMAQSTPSSQGPGPVYTRPADPNNPNSGDGAWFRDIPTLLGRYNVGSDIINSDVEGIEQALAAGHKVVVSVNGEIIWRKPVEDWDKHGNPAHNHSLVVTGVDTRNDMVHLNDSGSRQGRDSQIPLALFMQAWGASNDLMVVTS